MKIFISRFSLELLGGSQYFKTESGSRLTNLHMSIN